MAVSCKYGDEPAGSDATELRKVIKYVRTNSSQSTNPTEHLSALLLHMRTNRMHLRIHPLNHSSNSSTKKKALQIPCV
jgi:hypothetical protein